jgi:hypothetical protein
MNIEFAIFHVIPPGIYLYREPKPQKLLFQAKEKCNATPAPQQLVVNVPIMQNKCVAGTGIRPT